MIDLRKGVRVVAEWLEQTDGVVSGSQMKFCAKSRSVTGVITHIRGDHPTNPTSIRVWIQPDEGGEEVIVEPSWIKGVLG